MMTKLIAAAPLTLALSVAVAFGQHPGQAQPAAGQASKPAAPRLSVIETVKRSLQRMGASVDAGRSTAQMAVSNYSDPRGGKTTIVVVSDRTKNVLGLYVYNFGSLKDAANREEVYKYLLLANEEITIGAFFVDGDDDIGYKYLMNIGPSLNQAAFEASYLMMAAVARDRRPEIRKLLGSAAVKDEKTSDVRKAGESKAPLR
jgi:hypothetical protein